MPIQNTPWSDVLCCCICYYPFDTGQYLPVNLPCGHCCCRRCLQNLQSTVCPFDQTPITVPVKDLPVNTAFLKILLDGASIPSTIDIENKKIYAKLGANLDCYLKTINVFDVLAGYLKRMQSEKGASVWSQSLSRPLQRKLITLLSCQLLEPEGRSRASKAVRSLAERSLTELLLLHQNQHHLTSNLWAAVRARGCQFLGPAMQEEVLKLVLLALSEGAFISRKVLVMYIVQSLEKDYPQASKTSVGHVVQLLYRASCFTVFKRDGESSLMQLKEEFRSYEALRREHDTQIVQIAVEAGLRISPDQWSALLYGDQTHRSHMQSIIDKLQTPQSFSQSIQELLIAVQRTGDPGDLTKLKHRLEKLADIDGSLEAPIPSFTFVWECLDALRVVLRGQVDFCTKHSRSTASSQSYPRSPTTYPGNSGDSYTSQMTPSDSLSSGRYKTCLCRDVAEGRRCRRGENCTFAHSVSEMEMHRSRLRQMRKANLTRARATGLFQPQESFDDGPGSSGVDQFDDDQYDLMSDDVTAADDGDMRHDDFGRVDPNNLIASKNVSEVVDHPYHHPPPQTAPSGNSSHDSTPVQLMQPAPVYNFVPTPPQSMPPMMHSVPVAAVTPTPVAMAAPYQASATPQTAPHLAYAVFHPSPTPSPVQFARPADDIQAQMAQFVNVHHQQMAAAGPRLTPIFPQGTFPPYYWQTVPAAYQQQLQQTVPLQQPYAQFANTMTPNVLHLEVPLPPGLIVGGSAATSATAQFWPTAYQPTVLTSSYLASGGTVPATADNSAMTSLSCRSVSMEPISANVIAPPKMEHYHHRDDSNQAVVGNVGDEDLTKREAKLVDLQIRKADILKKLGDLRIGDSTATTGGTRSNLDESNKLAGRSVMVMSAADRAAANTPIPNAPFMRKSQSEESLFDCGEFHGGFLTDDTTLLNGYQQSSGVGGTTATTAFPGDLTRSNSSHLLLFKNANLFQRPWQSNYNSWIGKGQMPKSVEDEDEIKNEWNSNEQQWTSINANHGSRPWGDASTPTLEASGNTGFWGAVTVADAGSVCQPRSTTCSVAKSQWPDSVRDDGSAIAWDQRPADGEWIGQWVASTAQSSTSRHNEALAPSVPWEPDGHQQKSKEWSKNVEPTPFSSWDTPSLWTTVAGYAATSWPASSWTSTSGEADWTTWAANTGGNASGPSCSTRTLVRDSMTYPLSASYLQKENYETGQNSWSYDKTTDASMKVELKNEIHDIERQISNMDNDGEQESLMLQIRDMLNDISNLDD